MKKVISIMMMLLLAMTSFVGCGKSDSSAGGDSSKESSEGTIIKYNLSVDPKTLDPALNAAVDGAKVLVNLYEGLMRLDENDKAIPGVAEKVDVSEDGLTYTFHLRDSKWSDGKPVTAKDFEYSWKRVLDPATAAEYAYQLYYLKNGEKYNAKQAKVEDVGVKAIDDKTLQVTLEMKVPYFLELMAFPTYFPVRQDMVEKGGERWALDAETAISNGPFQMTKWARNDVISIAKNENYYDKDRVKIAGVDFTMMIEATTAFSAFKNGEVDAIDLVPVQQIPQLKKDKDPNFNIYPQLGVYYIAYNVTKEPMNDPKVRRALSLALDRRAITDVVCKGGEVPATGFVPTGIKDAEGNDYTKNTKDYGLKESPQVEEAKKLLAEAGYPDGAGFPKVTYIYNSDERHKAVAEALQDMWKKNLGIDVELQNQEWNVFQTTRTSGDFILCRDGWVADYVDPMTFLDMFLSTSGNNHAQYKSPEYDKLIADSRTAADPKARFDILHKAEDMLMTQDIVAPLFFYTDPKMVNEKIKGFRVSPLGFIYFDGVTIE